MFGILSDLINSAIDPMSCSTTDSDRARFYEKQTTCGSEELFLCACGADTFTYKYAGLYCRCGRVYDLKGDTPREVI